MKPIIAIRIHIGAKGNRCARWFENTAIVMAKTNAAAHGGVDKRFAWIEVYSNYVMMVGEKVCVSIGSNNHSKIHESSNL